MYNLWEGGKGSIQEGRSSPAGWPSTEACSNSPEGCSSGCGSSLRSS